MILLTTQGREPDSPAASFKASVRASEHVIVRSSSVRSSFAPGDQELGPLTSGGTATGGTAGEESIEPYPRGAFLARWEEKGPCSCCLGPVFRRLDMWLCRRRRNLTRREIAMFMMLVVGVMLVYLVFAQLFTTMYRMYPIMDFNHCVVHFLEYSPVIGYCLIVFVVINPFMFTLLLNVKESHSIVVDHLISIVCGTTVVCLVLFSANNILIAIMPILITFATHCLNVIVPTVRSHWDDYCRKRFKLKHNMESFNVVLADRKLFQSFKEYVAADLSIENALFWEEYQMLMKKTLKHFTKSRRPTAWSLNSTNPTLPPSTGATLAVLAPDYTPLGSQSSNLGLPHRTPSEPRGGAPNSPPSSSSSPPPSLSHAHAQSQAAQQQNPVLPQELRWSYTRFYRTFMEEGAPHEVNLSWQVTDELKKKWVAAGGGRPGESGECCPWSLMDFEKAKDEVVRLMYMNVYPRWIDDIRKGEKEADSAMS
ncbi:hypothetical protein HK101_011460 [Irineochytrium annulatum]|nr:hypothetical protein HK101_011460 [Irineochytrium annulatum]